MLHLRLGSACYCYVAIDADLVGSFVLAVRRQSITCNADLIKFDHDCGVPRMPATRTQSMHAFNLLVAHLHSGAAGQETCSHTSSDLFRRFTANLCLIVRHA